MSIALMTIAWQLDLPATEKLVLLSLADNANDAGCCWPAMGTIARKCGLSDRAVRAALRRLEDRSLLTSRQRAGTSPIYTIHPGTSFRPTPEAGSAPPRHEVPPTPERRSAKPTNEPTPTESSTPSERRTRKARDFVVPDWVPIEPWNGWLEMRKAKKAPLDTQRAFDLAIAKLKELADDGHPPGEVLDQSTFRKWTGLFELKDNRNVVPRTSNRLPSLRGERPDPALDMWRQATAELDAAGGGAEADFGAWPALSAE